MNAVCTDSLNVEFWCISVPVNNATLIRECKSNRDRAGQDLSEGGADSWPPVSE